MKLSKLLKKVSVTVSVLMIAGMLAACSSPSGGSSSGSGSGDGNGTGNGTENNGKTPAGQGTGETGNPSSEKTDEEGLTAKYGDIIFVEGMPLKNKTAIEKSFTSGTDYSVSGNVYTFTSSGLDRYIQLMGQAMNPAVSNPVAIVVYKNNAMMVLDQADFDECGSMLEKGTDYTLAANNRIILLTKAGYDKMKDGKDSGSGSSGSDGEKSKLIYQDENETVEIGVDSKYFDDTLKYYGLIEGTDYVKDSSGKNAKLTKTGYDKVKAKDHS